MRYTIDSYNPPKPYYQMSIKELLKHNKKCIRLDKYFRRKNTLKGGRKRKTRNKKNRKTRRRRKKKTRKFLPLEDLDIKIEN